jgi:hypothetical protein
MKKGRKSRAIGPKQIALSDEMMQKEIGKCKYYFKSKDPRKMNILQERISLVRERNNGLIPCIDKEYFCETCGSKDGREHPDTAYCFYCDTDNWYPVHEDVGR